MARVPAAAAGSTLRDEAISIPEFARRLPKAELHLHLDGSLFPDWILQQAFKQQIPLPPQLTARLRRAKKKFHEQQPGVQALPAGAPAGVLSSRGPGARGRAAWPASQVDKTMQMRLPETARAVPTTSDEKEKQEDDPLKGFFATSDDVDPTRAKIVSTVAPVGLQQLFNVTVRDFLHDMKGAAMRQSSANAVAANKNWGVFDFCNQFLQTREALSEATEVLLKHLAVFHNVKLCELRFCPALHVAGELTASAAVEAVLEGFERATRQVDIVGGVIVCALRSFSREHGVEMAELAGKYLLTKRQPESAISGLLQPGILEEASGDRTAAGGSSGPTISTPVKISRSAGGAADSRRQQQRFFDRSRRRLHAQLGERIKPGVVGFDVAGDEGSYPISLHAVGIKKAYELGVPITIHAGEWPGVNAKRSCASLCFDKEFEGDGKKWAAANASAARRASGTGEGIGGRSGTGEGLPLQSPGPPGGAGAAAGGGDLALDVFGSLFEDAAPGVAGEHSAPDGAASSPPAKRARVDATSDAPDSAAGGRTTGIGRTPATRQAAPLSPGPPSPPPTDNIKTRSLMRQQIDLIRNTNEHAQWVWQQFRTYERFENMFMIPQRLGHGCQLAGDGRFMAAVFSNDVTVECCLTSNVGWKIKSYRDHPVKKLLLNGVKVCLNSDNLLLSGDKVRRAHPTGEVMHFLEDVCGWYKATSEDSHRSGPTILPDDKKLKPSRVGTPAPASSVASRPASKLQKKRRAAAQSSATAQQPEPEPRPGGGSRVVVPTQPLFGTTGAELVQRKNVNYEVLNMNDGPARAGAEDSSTAGARGNAAATSTVGAIHFPHVRLRAQRVDAGGDFPRPELPLRRECDIEIQTVREVLTRNGVNASFFLRLVQENDAYSLRTKKLASDWKAAFQEEADACFGRCFGIPAPGRGPAARPAIPERVAPATALAVKQ
mmetsp:Transcript_16629/g.41107  ORF Transcript_16629/g.41107 Transcript_16629/m.41107 type:complete len:946 (+) Transcript_16629:80-2917(+)